MHAFVSHRRTGWICIGCAGIAGRFMTLSRRFEQLFCVQATAQYKRFLSSGNSQRLVYENVIGLGHRKKPFTYMNQLLALCPLKSWQGASRHVLKKDSAPINLCWRLQSCEGRCQWGRTIPTPDEPSNGKYRFLFSLAHFFSQAYRKAHSTTLFTTMLRLPATSRQQ